MRLLVRAAAVAAGAALAVSGLGPAVGVEPAVPLSKAGPPSAWGRAAPGTGDNISSVLAIPASLRKRAVRAISVQSHLGVVATADGRVTAWGDDDAVNAGAVPAPAGLRNVVDVRAINGNNGISAVALTGDGRVTAWGATGGGVTDIPATVQGHVAAIDSANDYVMALTDQGKIVQWGNSPQTSSGFEVPADIQGDVVGISVSKDAGSTTGGKLYAPNLALLKDGTVRAWGNPHDSDSAWDVPEDIQGNVAKVVTGPAPAAILDDGTLRFWGRVPDPSSTDADGCSPALVPGDNVPYYLRCGLPDGLAEAKVADLRLSNANDYAMALTTTGDVYLWGGDKARYPTDGDTERRVSWTGPISTGVSAIAAADGFPAVAVVTTGLAIGSDPVVSGTARVGQTLTGTAGKFSGPTVATSSQWLANGAAIPGATGPTLALTGAYLGKRISYRTTAGSGADALTATSAQTPAVTTPASTEPSNPAGEPPQTKAQEKLQHDQAKLKKVKKAYKKAKKAYKKAHGHKKAKLEKKLKKLKKKQKKLKKKVKADKKKV